jgi:hypothetical protein
MRWSKWLGAVVGLVLSVVVGATSARADEPAALDSVAIEGDTVVGGTLTAVVVAHGDPAPTVEYQWLRCDARGKSCERNVGAGASYAVGDADVGSTLRVRVTVTNSLGQDEGRSAPTAVVGGGDPAPEPGPDPTPDPTPTPGPTPPPGPPPLPVLEPPPGPEPPPPSGGPSPSPQPGPSPSPQPPPTPSGQLPPASSAPATAPTVAHYLRPFPVVRVKGASVKGGAYIDLLRVTAPQRTRVTVNCSGNKRCPVRRLSRGPGRLRQFERFLPAGLRITIRATRAGYIGKYVRFIVRSHAAPSRRDRCLLPGRTRPVECPQ